MTWKVLFFQIIEGNTFNNEDQDVIEITQKAYYHMLTNTDNTVGFLDHMEIFFSRKIALKLSTLRKIQQMHLKKEWVSTVKEVRNKYLGETK